MQSFREERMIAWLSKRESGKRFTLSPFLGHMIWKRKPLSFKRQELVPLRRYHVLGKRMFRERVENMGLLQMMTLRFKRFGA